MEETHYLIPGQLKIIQNNNYFKFGNDSVLLADFTAIREGEKILELGSGSGVIPLLLAYKKDPGHILGLEIQPELVELARRNIELNNLEQAIDIKQGDLREIEEYLPANSHQVVVTNPPYLAVTGGKITPNRQRAIARHELEAGLEDVVRAAAWALNHGGRLFMVHLCSRLAEVISCLQDYRLEPKRLRLIQPRPHKSPNRFLIEARQNGNPGLEIEPVLVEYRDHSQEFTEEMKQIYGEDTHE